MLNTEAIVVEALVCLQYTERKQEMLDQFAANHYRQLEMDGQPVADQIYGQVFGSCRIQRFGEAHINWIDSKLGIDCVVTPTRGYPLTIAEKFLQYNPEKPYNTITIEVKNDSTSSKRDGDWYTGIAQMGAWMWIDGTQVVKWIVINMATLWLYDNAMGRYEYYDGLAWHEADNHGDLKSSFRWIDVRNLPPECIVAQEGYEL